MSLAYAHEKFREAVRTLATHPDAINDRLASALVPHVSSVQMERDVPEDLHEEYRAFWEQVTWGSPSAGEGTLQASARQMSVEDAVEVARLIYRFAYEFRGRLEEKRQA